MKTKHCRRLLYLLAAAAVLVLLAFPSVFAAEPAITVEGTTITIPAGLSVTTDEIQAVSGYNSGYTINLYGKITGGDASIPNQVTLQNRSSIVGGTFTGTVIPTSLSHIGGTAHLTSAATLNTSGSTQYYTIGDYAVIDCTVDLTASGGIGYVFGGTFNGTVTVKNGRISGGIFNSTVTNESSGNITDGTFNGSVTNNGTISGGIFNGTVNNQNSGKITGGTFGTFNGSVTNNGTISGGIFNGTVTNQSSGKITGGTFNGSVTNNGTISGGIFNGTVTNQSSGNITDGTFEDTVKVFSSAIKGGTVNGKLELGTLGFAEGNVHLTSGASVSSIGSTCGISGGTYDCEITVKAPLVVTGGTFNGNVTVADDSHITGGNFSGSVTNSGTISGGTFNGNVTNSGTISGGTFNGNVTNSGTINGGTFNGNVTNEKSGKIYASNPETDYPKNCPTLNCNVKNDGEIYATVYGDKFELDETSTGNTYVVVTLYYGNINHKDFDNPTTDVSEPSVSYRDFKYGDNVETTLENYSKSKGKHCSWHNYVSDSKTKTPLTEDQKFSKDPKKNVFLCMDCVAGYVQFRKNESDGNNAFDLRLLVEGEEIFMKNYDTVTLCVSIKSGSTLKTKKLTVYTMYYGVKSNDQTIQALDDYALCGVVFTDIQYTTDATATFRVELKTGNSTETVELGSCTLPANASEVESPDFS